MSTMLQTEIGLVSPLCGLFWWVMQLEVDTPIQSHRCHFPAFPVLKGGSHDSVTECQFTVRSQQPVFLSES
jgi:hypothetical protein